MDSENLTARIKKKASELGYDRCGVIPADPIPEYMASLDEHIRRYPEFRHLYEELQALADPRQQFPEAQSIIVCIRSYGKYRIPEGISRYIGKYYLCEHRLPYSREYAAEKEFEVFLSAAGLRVRKGGVTARWAAVRAGLGAFGRNNFIYTPFGSWIWIDAWIVDRVMEYEAPGGAELPCPPNCSRCIDSCPTKALSEPLMMNRGRCIAQLSYYAADLPSDDVREQMGTWLYGCDVCQDVCPLNKNRWQAADDFPGLNELATYLSLEKIVTLDEATFLSVIQPRFWYIGADGLWIWKCNALRAMANSGERKYEPYLSKARVDGNEKVREMATWAYNKLGL